jgi:hypothetical protein
METHIKTLPLLGLPGIPVSQAKKLEDQIQFVDGKLVKLGCKFINLKEKGAPKAWEIPSLPLATQAALMPSNNVPEVTSPAPLPVVAATIQPAKGPEQLKQWQREVMDARVAIMRLIERAAPMVGVNKAINTIVADSINNDLKLYRAANARKGQGRTLSYDGIMKWWMTWKKTDGNPQALAPKDTENYLEPAWAAAFMECWSKPQNPHLTTVLEEFYRKTGSALPSYTVPLHSQNGVNWGINKLCTVTDEVFNVNRTLLVFNRRFRKTKQGSWTDIKLGPPGLVSSS